MCARLSNIEVVESKEIRWTLHIIITCADFIKNLRGVISKKEKKFSADLKYFSLVISTVTEMCIVPKQAILRG